MAVSRRGDVRGRLDRLEAITPRTSGSPEARARMVEALDTLAGLIHEYADEINAGYKERIGRGEEHLDALIAAKTAVWEKTTEGRAALEVLDVVRERGA